jgi:1,4-dihydroxy-2-naphthoyl-CoA hydrolase
MKYLWDENAIDLVKLNALSIGTMAEFLGITFISLGHNVLRASMAVDNRSRQPYGVLHGGASAALAETIGSVASWICVGAHRDENTKSVVGIELNCNHLRSVKEGMVYAQCEPLHVGATIHVWDIKIKDEDDRLVCASRLTVAVLNRKV